MSDQGSPTLSAVEHDIVVASLASDEQHPYNVPVFVRFHGATSSAELRRAVEAVVDDVPHLRRRFRRVGRRLEAYAAPEPPAVADLVVTTLEDAARTRRLDVLDSALVSLACCRLDGTDEVWLYVNAHHALLDGWSLGILLRDVAARLGPGRAPDGQPGVPSTPGRRRGSFATALAAFTLTWARVVGQLDAPLAVPVLGRTTAQMGDHGSFARLVPASIDLTHRTQQPVRELVLAARGVGAEAARASMSALPTPGAAAAAPPTAVVFDYKTDALVSTGATAGQPYDIAVDTSYSDVKYDVHVTVHETVAGVDVTVSGARLPPGTEAVVAEEYDRMLRCVQDHDDRLVGDVVAGGMPVKRG